MARPIGSTTEGYGHRIKQGCRFSRMEGFDHCGRCPFDDCIYDEAHLHKYHRLLHRGMPPYKALGIVLTLTA